MPESKQKVSYNLQDFEIFTNSKSFDFSVWIPDKTYIVIGRANTAENSVHLSKAEKDGIELLKRPSGGEAVILSPKTVVISVKMKVDNVLKTHSYFKKINGKIIEALSNLGVKNLQMNGISDISIGSLKILGSSIYRYQNTVFYHAVLNNSESIKKIEKYLKHPKREPDYRKGRSHTEFVTSLLKSGYSIHNDRLAETILHALEGLRVN
jgi:lipoate-protein ligase A